MKYILPVIACLFINAVVAQKRMPVIKATSKKVSINDGGFLNKDSWTLSPKARPDIYTADRTRKTKWVTFYTDLDSIRVKVKPGTKYDLIVLLNGKDSCYTQIASAIGPENNEGNDFINDDTIPFSLTPYSAISVVGIINGTDTLKLHFDVGSFDVHLTKDAILNKTKLLQHQPSAEAGKVNANYNQLDKVYTLQMGTMILKAPAVSATGLTSQGMDGRFGWNLFEGKIVEVDYDKCLLIVHTKLPKKLKGYVKSSLQFIRSFVCAKAAFTIAGKDLFGSFMLDTGSGEAAILDSAWVAKQSFPAELKVIRTSTVSDPRGVKYTTKTVLYPLVKLNNFKLTNVPALVLGSRNPLGFEVNYFGNGLLKRFNMILDLKNDMLYLKPNKLMGLPYAALNGPA